MTASLPTEVQSVFDRFITTELTTIDAHLQPITWPVTPYYHPGDACIDVTTGLGYPKKAEDARANPKVALLFSDPTGSGLADAPMVLVQATAEVDDHDLDANRLRYARESKVKLPGTEKLQPPESLRRFMGWYYTRIYLHVRPERVYVWTGADPDSEPRLFDAHMEEVRSGHVEEPAAPHASPTGGGVPWDDRIEELGSRYRTAVLSLVSPDGFPFAIRVPVHADRVGSRVRIAAEPLGVPFDAGLACLTAHEHAPDFAWQRNFQVRGDLVRDEQGWALVPHKLVGGFELPPSSRLAQYRLNAAKMVRFRATAKRQLRQRAARGSG